MKKVLKLTMLSLMFLGFSIVVDAERNDNEYVAVYFKSTMDCHNCEVTLTNFLKFEKGVKDLKVDLKSNTIKVVFKSGKNSTENLQKGIKKQGYEANPISEKEYESLFSQFKEK
jgi:periplasmic mercuric ion binding protein